jgi:hypothetical protein
LPIVVGIIIITPFNNNQLVAFVINIVIIDIDRSCYKGYPRTIKADTTRFWTILFARQSNDIASIKNSIGGRIML